MSVVVGHEYVIGPSGPPEHEDEIVEARHLEGFPRLLRKSRRLVLVAATRYNETGLPYWEQFFCRAGDLEPYPSS